MERKALWDYFGFLKISMRNWLISLDFIIKYNFKKNINVKVNMKFTFSSIISQLNHYYYYYFQLINGSSFFSWWFFGLIASFFFLMCSAATVSSENLNLSLKSTTKSPTKPGVDRGKAFTRFEDLPKVLLLMFQINSLWTVKKKDTKMIRCQL